MNQQIRNTAAAAVMTALLCVISPVALPLAAGVPVSLATLGVMLAGALLGRKYGVLSVLAYIIIGMLGLPVFAGYTGGAAILFGMTGGYIFGYLPLAYMTGIAAERCRSEQGNLNRMAVIALGALMGNFVLYVIGTVWFMVYTGTALLPALTACVFPFIPGDLLKTAAVCILASRLEPAVQRFRQA